MSTRDEHRRRRRVLDDDGLDVVEYVDQDTPIAEYPEWARRPFGGFENMVAAAEQVWKAIAAAQPTKPGQGRPLSKAVYARKITWGIGLLRANLQKNPDLEPIVTLALSVGSDITDAKWRFNRGDLTRTGHRQRVKSPAAGRASGKERRRLAQERVDVVRTAAQKERAKHPDTRKLSTARLARQIADGHDLKYETVRKYLKALGLK